MAAQIDLFQLRMACAMSGYGRLASSRGSRSALMPNGRSEDIAARRRVRLDVHDAKLR
jgi:hypothetical protein